jgi:hypothetical protein
MSEDSPGYLVPITGAEVTVSAAVRTAQARSNVTPRPPTDREVLIFALGMHPNQEHGL